MVSRSTGGRTARSRARRQQEQAGRSKRLAQLTPGDGMADPEPVLLSREELDALPHGAPTYVLFENALADGRAKQQKQRRRQLVLLRTGAETDDPDVRDGFAADMAADDVAYRKNERLSDEWTVHLGEVALERQHRQALRAFAGAGLFGQHWTHVRPLTGGRS